MKQLLQHTLYGMKGFSQMMRVLVIVVSAYFAVMLVFSHVFLDHSATLTISEEQNEQVTNRIYEMLEIRTEDNGDTIAVIKYITQVTTCLTIGEYCNPDPDSSRNDFSQSLLGGMTTMISVPFSHPPSSSIAWAEQGLAQAGFVPDTHAAGVGFYSISVFSDLWQLFRDMSYFLVVLFVITVGFLIMFRVQIAPQTVISLENSLPRIVLVLIMITFSFAIVGFFVDVVYIALLIVFNIFGTLQESTPALAETDWLSANTLTWQYLGFTGYDNYNPFDQVLGWRYLALYKDAIGGIMDLIPIWLKSIGGIIMSIVIGTIIQGWGERLAAATGNCEVEGSIVIASIKINLCEILTSIWAFGFGALLTVLAIYLLPLLLGIIVLLILFFRIMFFLLSAYVQIIINTIFAPLFILPSIVPGNNSFIDWMKRIIGNLAVFPVTIVLLIVVQYMAYIDPTTNIAGLTTDTQFTLPGLNYLYTSSIAPIIAGSLMFLIPQLAGQIRDAIAGKPAIDAGPGVLFGGVAGGVGAIVGQYTGMATFSKQMGSDSPLGRLVGGWLPGVGGKKASGRANEPTSIGGDSSNG